MIEAKYILDTREKPQYRWTFSEHLKSGEFTEIKKVDTGDYTIAGLENYVCIDRKKSYDELVGDIFSDKERFKKELERAKKINTFYIICEFGYDKFFRGSKYSKITPKYLLSIINEIEITYDNIHFVFANDAKNAEFIAYRILSSALRIKNGDFRWA